jgi:hypothetical protein
VPPSLLPLSVRWIIDGKNPGESIVCKEMVLPYEWSALVGRGGDSRPLSCSYKQQTELIFGQTNFKHYFAQRLESKVIVGGYIPLLA